GNRRRTDEADQHNEKTKTQVILEAQHRTVKCFDSIHIKIMERNNGQTPNPAQRAEIDERLEGFPAAKHQRQRQTNGKRRQTGQVKCERHGAIPKEHAPSSRQNDGARQHHVTEYEDRSQDRSRAPVKDVWVQRKNSPDDVAKHWVGEPWTG